MVDEQDKWDVVLRGVSGERVVALRSGPEETVANLKRIVQEEFGYPPQSQQLLLHGDILEDDFLLEALQQPLSFTLVVLPFDHSEALFCAAEHGHEAAARSLLLRVARDSDETSDLLLAGAGVRHAALHCDAGTDCGHDAACRVFLAAARSRALSGQLMQLARFGWTALHYAAGMGHGGACRALLETAPDLTVRSEMLAARDCGSFTALHRAASEGHEAACRALLELCPAAKEMLAARDKLGNTALHLASSQGHTRAHRALLDFV